MPVLVALSAALPVGALLWQFARDFTTRAELSAAVTASQQAISEQIKSAVSGLSTSMRELRDDWKRHDDRLQSHGEALSAVKAEIGVLRSGR